jgi:hypothetical protein
MRRLSYTNTSVITDDRIANAVLQYSRELAEHDHSATVDIPVVTEDGTVISAELLIGPASELIVVDVPDAPLPKDMDVDGAVAAIRIAMERLTSPPSVQPEAGAERTGPDDDIAEFLSE